MQSIKGNFNTKLNNEFDKFQPYLNSKLPSITNSSTDVELNNKINVFGDDITAKQNEIVTNATDLLTSTVTTINEKYGDIINEQINDSQNSIVENINGPSTPTAGGRPSRKSRKTKHNKKSKKTKSRRRK
jgi:hypothetical protein